MAGVLCRADRNPLQGVPSDEGSLRRLCPPMQNVPQPVERVNTTLLLRRLRVEMRKNTLTQGPPMDAFIITTDDDHQVNGAGLRFVLYWVSAKHIHNSY